MGLGPRPDYKGLLVCPLLSRKPSEAERKLGEWADSRGLLVLMFAVEGDEGEDVLLELGIEEQVGNRMLSYTISLPALGGKVWPEMLDHYEKLLRAGFKRFKAEQARYPWWEHVP